MESIDNRAAVSLSEEFSVQKPRVQEPVTRQSLSDLPEELLESILDHYDANAGWKPPEGFRSVPSDDRLRPLRSLLRVSKQFRRLVEPRIYSCYEYDDKQHRKFLRTCIARPDLAGAVRFARFKCRFWNARNSAAGGLDAAVAAAEKEANNNITDLCAAAAERGWDETFVADLIAGRKNAELAFSLSLLPNLTGLDFVAPQTWPTDCHLRRFIEAQPISKLAQVQLSGGMEGYGSETLGKFLAAPSVRAAHCSGMTFRGRELWAPRSSQVEHIALEECSLQAADLWALCSACTALKSLALNWKHLDEWSGADLDLAAILRAIDLHAASLSRLALLVAGYVPDLGICIPSGACIRHPAPGASGSLKALNITELEITQPLLAGPSPTPRSAHDFADLADVFPASLNTLKIHINAHLPAFVPFLSALASLAQQPGKLPQLRRVVLLIPSPDSDCDTPPWLRDALAELRAAFADVCEELDPRGGGSVVLGL
ncbi:uncharacterized protein K452DRAFT_159019 [Aplosporella prunicola CBS 121167]|uniref:F-box domain-containing protein n=1 Tax=Aplosporella prunicola CBS 121167 TaxID=1176127 RepID=A0A6A6AXV6_9PEZI|nr:uncharacterized protein K452DRAFT_159019 [Aplosporella prunicola CBS 121167]KAF2135805.1 hypothetical protein K452DRAFT_159019 [Aplosporella prunicola CBS 121167]